MKVVAVLMCLSASLAFGQSASQRSEPTDLIVLRQSWSSVTSPGSYEDPFAGNDRVQDSIRAQQEAAVRNAIRTKEGQGRSREYSAVSPASPSLPARLPSSRYAYHVKLKNTGTMTITRIGWDYLFLNPDTLQEAGRRSFDHEVKVRAGKAVELSRESGSPPIRVIDATKPAQADSRYAEKIVITRIEYADGSVWKLPAN